MMEKNKYHQLWSKYVPLIELQLKNAKNGEREIKLYRHEFEDLGNKRIANYSFNLETSRGKLNKTVATTAVGRGLYDQIINKESVKELLKKNDYKISMGKEFILKIKRLDNETNEESGSEPA